VGGGAAYNAAALIGGRCDLRITPPAFFYAGVGAVGLLHIIRGVVVTVVTLNPELFFMSNSNPSCDSDKTNFSPHKISRILEHIAAHSMSADRDSRLRSNIATSDQLLILFQCYKFIEKSINRTLGNPVTIGVQDVSHLTDAEFQDPYSVDWILSKGGEAYLSLYHQFENLQRKQRY
jgi:hypothetical protein